MDRSKLPGLSVYDLLRDSVGSAKQLQDSLGISSRILSAVQMSSSGVLDDFRKLGLGVDRNQLLGTLSAIGLSNQSLRFDIREFGIPNLNMLSAVGSVAGLPSDVMKLVSAQKAFLPQSVLADMERITGFTRGVLTTRDMAAMFRTADSSGLLSTTADLNAMMKAVGNLPSWLRPVSTLQAFQPSWEVAATLALSGIGRPGLIHDALTALHTVRAETTGFEAVVQMLQIADEAEDDLEDRVLGVLRMYAAAIVQLLEQSKDWVRSQGLMQNLVLLVMLITFYDSHRSRVDADIQTTIAIEQSHNAHAQSEIDQHREDLTQSLSHFLEQKSTDKDARVLIRAAPLRATPEAKGIIIRQLFPDDRVRVLEVQGGWARVDVYEYNSENVTNGWINRRALRLPER